MTNKYNINDVVFNDKDYVWGIIKNISVENNKITYSLNSIELEFYSGEEKELFDDTIIFKQNKIHENDINHEITELYSNTINPHLFNIFKSFEEYKNIINILEGKGDV